MNPADIVITLDADWAPDFVIDAVAARLVEHRVAATWFVTHQSAAIDRLRRHDDLFELGIHPNFLPGSTQGRSPEQILEHCLGIVPDAHSIRTHTLMQSTPLLELLMRHTAIRTDVSLFLPHAPGIVPVEYWWHGRMLLRVPYLWEDDFEMERPTPIWHVDGLFPAAGLKVFDFHPIHVYLNSPDTTAYERLKRLAPALGKATAAETAPLIYGGDGAGTAFDTLVRAVAPTGGRTIRDVFAAATTGSPA